MPSRLPVRVWPLLLVVALTQAGCGAAVTNPSSAGASDLRSLASASGSGSANLWIDDQYYGLKTRALEVFAPGATSPFFTIKSSNKNHACMLAFDKAGNVYESNQPSGKSLFTPGGFITVYPPGSTKPSHEIKAGINYPTQMLFGTDGTLYVTNIDVDNSTDQAEGWISEYDSDLKFVRRIKSGGDDIIPYSLALDASNNLYAAYSLANSAEIRVFPSGAVKPARQFPIAHLYPSQIAFDSSGNLNVLNGEYGKFNGSVTVYTPDGELLRTIKSQIYLPEGFIFDSAGNLYVANEEQNGKLWHYGDVTEYTPGATQPNWKIIPKGPSGEFQPDGIATDSASGILYINGGLSIDAYLPPSKVKLEQIPLSNVGAIAVQPVVGSSSVGTTSYNCQRD